MQTDKQLMIGGQALFKLGSTRHTEDTDYLIYDESVKTAFIHDRENNVDYCNAAANPLFKRVWQLEEANIGPLASPQALLELKLYAWVQHLVNGHGEKALHDEHDIKWLLLKYKELTESKAAVWHVTVGQAREINKFLVEARTEKEGMKQ